MSEIEETPTDEPEVVENTGTDEAAEAPAAETLAEKQERLYADKYKTADELERGYKETDAARTRAQQEAAELREQIAAYEEAQNQPEPFNPLANFGLDDDDWKNIARSVETNPQGTLEWAMSDEIKAAYPEMEKAVKQYWSSLDPWQTAEEAAKRAFAGERERIENLQRQWDERAASESQERQAANVKLAMAKISDLPDFQKHRGRIAELVSQHALRDDDPRFTDPDQMFDYAYTMYSRAVHEDYQREAAKAAAAGDEPTPAAAGAKARTQTRSTASAKRSGEDPATQAYLDAMSA